VALLSDGIGAADEPDVSPVPDELDAALPPEVSGVADEPAGCPVPVVPDSVDDPEVPGVPDVPVEPDGCALPDAPGSVLAPGVVPASDGVPGAAVEPGAGLGLDVSGAPGAACPEVELSAPLLVLVPEADVELSCPPETGACSCLSHANSTGKSRRRRVCRFMMVTIG